MENKLDVFKDYLDAIDKPEQRARTEELLTWVHRQYPQLDTRIAWGTPHFTHHGTFILAISLAQKHMAISPESKPLEVFADEIRAAGYDATRMLMRIPWQAELNYGLLKTLIDYNLEDKKGMTSYWRKPED